MKDFINKDLEYEVFVYNVLRYTTGYLRQQNIFPYV